MTLPSTIAGLNYYVPEDVHDHVSGLEWYNEAHKYALYLSELTNKPLDIVCAVIAVISPAVTWEINKTDAFNLLMSESPRDIVISSYGLNKKKAVHIIETGDLTVLKGRKVTAFYHNIVDPLCDEHVTIDRHAIRACYGKAGLNMKPEEIPPPTSSKRYKHFSALYRRLAKKHGVTAVQMQAVIWVEYKRKSNP